MIHPEKFSNLDINNLFVPGHIFDSARKLHLDEAYIESNIVLEKAFSFAGKNIIEHPVFFYDAMVLFGWNLVLSRRFDEFESWLKSIKENCDPVTEAPEFRLFHLKLAADLS